MQDMSHTEEQEKIEIVFKKLFGNISLNISAHATIFSLWISKPQEISKRSFIQTASFIIELTGDLPEIIWTLLLVLSVKDATICCTQGQNIYVEKRGENPPRYNQT